ncbi:hypothetical protein V8E53_014459, partial [Lactarius tabidus]
EDGEVKLIWWFVTVHMGEVEVEGTQTAVESFTFAFVDVGEALQLEAFHADRDVITKAES